MWLWRYHNPLVLILRLGLSFRELHTVLLRYFLLKACGKENAKVISELEKLREEKYEYE